jgi:hypothetical protein
MGDCFHRREAKRIEVSQRDFNCIDGTNNVITEEKRE